MIKNIFFQTFFYLYKWKISYLKQVSRKVSTKDITFVISYIKGRLNLDSKVGDKTLVIKL